MTAATDKELATLHKKVAEVMIKALDASSISGALLDEFGEDLPDKVRDFLEACTVVNPALIQSITKFLRDNDITAEVEHTKELTDLQKRLSNKQRKTVNNVIPFEED